MSYFLNKTYSIPPQTFLILDGLSKDGSRVFKDWESFDADKISGYFEAGYAVFTKRLQIFKSLKRPLTEAEANELIFMLESLVHAKNIQFEQFKN